MRFFCPTCRYTHDISKAYITSAKLKRKKVDEDVFGGRLAYYCSFIAMHDNDQVRRPGGMPIVPRRRVRDADIRRRTTCKYRRGLLMSP